MKLRMIALIAALGFAGQVARAQETDPSAGPLTLKRFSLSSQVIQTPATGVTDFTVAWETVGKSPLGMYSVAGYVFAADDTVRKAGDANRFLFQNCSGIPACGSPHEQKCSTQRSGRLSCSVGAGVLLKPGRYVAVGKACAYDSTMKEVCSEREQAFSVR